MKITCIVMVIISISFFHRDTTAIEFTEDKIAREFSLDQNYLNPFNPRTNIEFSIPKSELVTLKIFNLLRQEVTTLVSEKLKACKYKCTWDASEFASGTYFYNLETENPSTGSGSIYTQTRKMVLLR